MLTYVDRMQLAVRDRKEAAATFTDILSFLFTKNVPPSASARSWTVSGSRTSEPPQPASSRRFQAETAKVRGSPSGPIPTPCRFTKRQDFPSRPRTKA